MNISEIIFHPPTEIFEKNKVYMPIREKVFVAFLLHSIFFYCKLWKKALILDSIIENNGLSELYIRKESFRVTYSKNYSMVNFCKFEALYYL